MAAAAAAVAKGSAVHDVMADAAKADADVKADVTAAIDSC